MPIVGHLTVPEEVFQRILCYTPRESLPLLSLVSKSWYMSVTPILYRNIELVWRRTQYFCRETLGRRLWYKKHGGPCSCEEQAPCKPEHHPEETFGKRGCFLSKRDLSFTASLGEAKWIRELDKGSPSAFVALLLVYLENLEAVEMSAGFQRLFSFLGPYTLKSLTRLTTASIGAFLDEVFMGPGRTSEAGSESLSSLTLFQLPKVRRLSLNIPKPLEDRKFVWPDMTSPPVNIYLTSLELAFTFLDEHDLAYVLKTCPRLRSLKYDLWTTVKDDEVTETEEAIVRLSALQQALLPVKATLETFHLHIEKYHWASGS
ncbi:hypothetical protein D6C85_01422 [Aureobasidium pullulans]|uniref:F-box domain-containing protein n=1 Tax=Aureobasidium pullulans TaxID=5580 RepID=A0A4S9XEM4_AURPU|nr:hypothetical protein D6C85_01422 [Aureobasidium pullulans]